MKILCIDTATSNCSAAISLNGQIMAEKTISDSHANSSKLTVIIDDLLKEQKIDIKSIDAVAINKGPGSYTGLRIGTSTAKGICYAIGKPLIAIGSLEAMAWAFNSANGTSTAILCPMIDARRMEVYTALFDNKMQQIAQVEAKIINQNSIADALEHS